MRLLICLMLCAGVLAAKRRYDGHRMVSVFPKSVQDLLTLHTMEMDPTFEELDFWTEPSRIRPTDIRVSPNDFVKFESTLQNAGIEFNITHDNLQIDIEMEEARMRQPRPNSKNLIYACDFVSRYCTFNEVNEIIDYFASGISSSVQVEVTVIGQSYEGRDIRQVKVAKDLTSPKPSIFLEAATHSREWVTVPAVLKLIQRLLLNEDADSNMMLDSFDWYVIPVHNPDGFVYSHTNDRLWRKNRRPCPTLPNVFGVDLNRNWDADFGGAGTSGSCRSDIYMGTGAFSESETAAMRDSVDAVKKSTTGVYAYFSVHSYGEMLIIPYAYTIVKPQRYSDLYAATVPMMEELYQVSGSSPNWLVGTSPDILYAAAGGSDDFFYLFGVPYSYTYELRPAGNPGFLLPEDQIDVAADELFYSLVGFAAQGVNWPSPDEFPETAP